MKKCLMVSSVAMMAVVAVWCVAGAQAQTAAADARDFSGIWKLTKAAGPPWLPNANAQFASEMSLQPWAQQHCKEVGCARAVDSAGGPRGDAYFQGKDPALFRCAPYGFPRIMLEGDYMEIFETRNRNRMFMHMYRNNPLREIWLDGRKNPVESVRPWTGHSTGRWERDTLVVETTGLVAGENGKYKWLDGAGFPHSDQLHVVERISRPDRKTLQIDMTLTDPKTFKAPIRSTLLYGLVEDAEVIASTGPSVEYVQCEDRVYADKDTETWPFVSKDYDYKPQFPRNGTSLYEGGD